MWLVLVAVCGDSVTTAFVSITGLSRDICLGCDNYISNVPLLDLAEAGSGIFDNALSQPRGLFLAQPCTAP